MKYNKWKEANDYWRMVINKPFKIRGRNIMLLNYIENYYVRQNKSSYATKAMHRFIKYLNNMCKEIHYSLAYLNMNRYYLIYRDEYKRELIGINPYISITLEQVRVISNFISASEHYNRACYNRYKLKKSIINNLLDAIDAISSIQGILRQHKYNIIHKRKHPYPLISNNYIDYIERHEYIHTQYYNDYKQFSLKCLRQNIDITKTFYKYNPSMDVSHIF